MAEKVKKKISGKKITLIIISSLLAALVLAAGLFFGISSCTNKGNKISDLKEGYTVRKEVPTDGSTPAEHSGIDNIGYMAYVLDNQPFYHAYAYNSTKSTGYEQVTQTWKDYKSAAKNGTANNVMVCSDLSYSSLVKASTQTCFVGDDSAYMRNGKKPSKNSVPADIEWSGDQPAFYNAESYGKKYGAFSTELSVYVINADTVESCEDVIDNGNGTYSQKFVLKEDAACWYQYGMKTRGSLKSLPEFKKIEITFTFDGGWQVLETYCEEKTDIAPSALGGMSMSSTAKTTTTFDYSEAGFDEVHYSLFNSYYKNYVGKDISGPVDAPDEPALLDVLGGGFSKVVDPNGNGQKFALDIKLGDTQYSGTAYAKLGDMGDILGSLDVRVALGRKDAGKQDLYIEFKGGALNLYYSDEFAMLADINGVADSVTKIINWANGLGKVEAQDVAYALSGDTEASESSSGLNLDSLLAALSFTYTDTSACIALVSDDLLGLGIGLDVKINFDRFKGEDGSAYAFKNFDLSSLSFKGSAINLSASLLPDDNAADLSHNESEASANLSDYINGVYGLLNSNTYVVDLKLDGSSEIEYINGLTLNASAKVAQTNGFKEISVSVPVSVKYGNLSLELEAYYTVNLSDGSYGTVYLWVKNVSGQPANVKVYCEINEVINAVTEIIGYFTPSPEKPADGGSAQTPETQADGKTAEKQEVNTVAKIINIVLGLDYGAIISDLKADNNSISLTVNLDEILKSFDINIGLNAGSLALTLANGEKATLSGTDSELGLTVKLIGSDESITVPDTSGYGDLTSYVNGVYNLLTSNSIIVNLELDGTSEIEYINGLTLNATAQVKPEDGFNKIAVNVPLSVSYGKLSLELEAYYTVDLTDGSYGTVYLWVKSVSGRPASVKVYCNVDEVMEAVNKIIDMFTAEEEDEQTPAPRSEETNEEAEAEEGDKIAKIIKAVIAIDYGKIINEISANSTAVAVNLNADEILKAFSVDFKLKLGDISLVLGLDKNKVATLSGGVKEQGLTLAVSGSKAVLSQPETKDYADVTSYVNGVYNLLNANSIAVNIELDGTGEIEYFSGVKLIAEAKLKLENGYNDISVLLPLNVSYKNISVEINVYYTVNLESGSYGEIYLDLVSINNNPYGFKVYCNADETVNAVNGLIELINSIGKTEDGGEEEQAPARLSDEQNAEATDKIATIINAVIAIDYGKIINGLIADTNGVSIAVNADEVLKAFGVELGGLSLGELKFNLGIEKDKNGNNTAVLSGGLEKLGLTLNINGSDKVLKAPEEEYLNVNEFIEIVRAAAEQVKAIIETESIEFSLDDLALTIDGVKTSINGNGEVSWQNGKIRVAAEVTLAIAENGSGNEVKVVFVYDEASAPLVRFTVNGLGLEIYEEDITEISVLVNKITEAIKSFTGNVSDGSENGATEEDKTENASVTAFSNDGEETNNLLNLLASVLDGISKVTIELRDSEIENADVKDIFISYANCGKLALSANGGLAIKLNIADDNGTEIANFVASVSAGNGANFNNINEKLDNSTFCNKDTFVEEVYNYVLDVLDGLSVKNLLGSDTYTVDVAFNGTDSGIAALEGIIVNAHLYYTEVEEAEKLNKLVEADLDIDIGGTKVVAKAYIYQRTVYISLEHIAGTDLNDIAFKADADCIFDAALTLVDVITSRTLAEIVAMINGGNAVSNDGAEGGEEGIVALNGEEGKTALANVLTYILTLDFSEVVSYEKIDGKNTLTVKPDGILEAFGVNVKIGAVKVAIDPVTHAIEASVAGDKEWLTFNAQAVENSEHGSFNSEGYIDINFVSTLLEDINKSLKYVEANSPEGEILFSLKTGENEKIDVNIISIKNIVIDDITFTIGIKADNSFYFTFRGHLNGSIFLFTPLTAESYISVTYSNGYLTLGRDVDNPENAIYKVMTLDYLIDNLTDKNNSPVRWLLGTSDANWNLLSGVLNDIMKLRLDSGLTSTEDLYLYYLYGGTVPDSGEGEQTPSETVKQFSLSDYINGISVNLANGYSSNYGNADSALKQLGLSNATDYYAFDVNLSALVSEIKSLYAAILRDENGLKGLYAYADIAGFVTVKLNISGGLTADHAPDYRDIVNEKYNVNYNNFAGQEYKTFGCFSSEGNGSYAASDYNRPYELTVYGYNDVKNDYVINQHGGKLLLSKTLNSGSVVHLLEDEIWLDGEQTVKLIYVDENGNDLGNVFRITSNIIIYQVASGKNMITLHSPYEEDREIEGFLGSALESPKLTVSPDGNQLFAGWYADENYSVPVTGVQEGVTEYYARFLDKYYTAGNGVTYEFSNVANEADKIPFYYTAVSFVNGADKDYSVSENVLEIADYINGFPVTAIGHSAFLKKSLKKVIVPETVTRVEAQAFMDNKGMELAVFLAPSVYFGGEDWSGNNRFVFYGCGISDSNEKITNLNLYFNNATSYNGNTDWFGFKKDGKNYYFIGDEGHGGSRNGKYIDDTGTEVLRGTPWAYIEYDIKGADGADLSELKNGVATVGKTKAEIEAYVLRALNEMAKPNGYINAYNVEVSGGFEINENSFGYAYTVEITVTGSLEPAWYQLTVQTNYNGNATGVNINGNYELIGESANSVSYYVQGGAEITLNAVQAEGGVYVFNGWNVNGEKRELPANATFTMYSEVTEIKAVWQAAENDNITVISSIGFTYNGVEQNSGETLEKAVVGDNLAIPEAEGYTFLGWAQLGADGTLNIAENTFIQADTVATYYALWVASREDVSFTVNGATVSAAVSEVCDGTLYGWYNGTDISFNGAPLPANEDNSFTFTTESTAVRARLQYSLTVKIQVSKANTTKWVYSANIDENNVIDPKFEYKAFKGWTVTQGTEFYDGNEQEFYFNNAEAVLEGYTVRICRMWENAICIKVSNGEQHIITYLIKGFATSTIGKGNIRGQFSNGTTSGLLISDGWEPNQDANIKKVADGDKVLYYSEYNSGSTPLVFATMESIRGNVSFTVLTAT